VNRQSIDLEEFCEATRQPRRPQGRSLRFTSPQYEVHSLPAASPTNRAASTSVPTIYGGGSTSRRRIMVCHGWPERGLAQAAKIRRLTARRGTARRGTARGSATSRPKLLTLWTAGLWPRSGHRSAAPPSIAHFLLILGFLLCTLLHGCSARRTPWPPTPQSSALACGDSRFDVPYGRASVTPSTTTSPCASSRRDACRGSAAAQVHREERLEYMLTEDVRRRTVSTP
jgi:hypothetical protein